MRILSIFVITSLIAFSCSKKSEENSETQQEETSQSESVLYELGGDNSLSEADAKEVVEILSKIYGIDSLQGSTMGAEAEKANEGLAIEPGENRIILKPIGIEITNPATAGPQASKNWAVDEKVFLHAVDRRAINYNNRTIPEDLRDDYDRLIEILNRNNIPIITQSPDAGFGN